MHDGFVQSPKIQANNSLDNLPLLRFMVYVKFMFCVVQLPAQQFLPLPVFCGVNMWLGSLAVEIKLFYCVKMVLKCVMYEHFCLLGRSIPGETLQRPQRCCH